MNMVKIASTRYINSIGGSLIFEPDKCPTKEQIESADPSITIEGDFASNQLITEPGIRVHKDPMDNLNDFIRENGYYCKIGISADSTPDMLPFMYDNSAWQLRGCGCVDSTGAIKTWQVSDRQFGNPEWGTNMSLPALAGKYLFVRNGSGSMGNNYLCIKNINTGENVWSNTGYKYVGGVYFCEYDVVNKISTFYLDISQSYRPLYSVSITDNGTVSESLSSDRSWNGLVVGQWILGKDGVNYKSVLINIANYRDYYFIERESPLTMLNDADYTKLLTGYRYAEGNIIQTASSRGLILTNVNTETNYLIDYNGNIQKELDTNVSTSNRYMYAYYKGIIWRNQIGVIGPYTKTNY